MSALPFWATISILFSFLYSILEAVLLSIIAAFKNLKKQESKEYAFTLDTLKNDVDKPLIATLTLNTFAHPLGAMMVGIVAEKLPYKIKLFGINTIGIVATIMTFLILVASEITPKTIGATSWKKLAGFTARPLNYFNFSFKMDRNFMATPAYHKTYWRQRIWKHF